MPSIIRATTTSGLQVAPDNSGSLILQTNGTTTALTIDTSQNVGIGTTSPAAKLVIEGGTSTDQFRLGTGSNYYQIGRESASTGYLNFYGTQTGANGYVFGGVNGERMRIDSAGNVGIGTTSPTSTFGTNVLQMYGSAATEMRFTSGNSGTTSTDGLSVGIDSSSVAYFYHRENQPIVFGTNNIERMRIDSSGNVIIGKATTDIATVGSYISSTAGLFTTFTISSGTNEMSIYNNTSTGGNARLDFRVVNVSKGYIQWNNTNTTYSTTSDYRLKENIASMTGALDTVAQLNPVTYNWKADGSNGQGFIAHELQEVVPDCVTGEKDAVDAEGNPKYQGIDTSFLVATLTAAIQEQQTIINDLKARIETLEAK
jgi:hypothetical protein